MKAVFAAAWACLLLTSACAVEPIDYPTGNKEFDQFLVTAFQFAIDDAKVRTPERQHKLISLTKENKDVVWRLPPFQDQLLVVGVFEPSFDPAGKTATRDYWVTAAPELRKFHAAHQEEFQRPMLRLKQLLGLSPSGSYTQIVEFWVRLDDIFRPSPDRETSDDTANLDFDSTDQSPVAKAHRDWCDRTQDQVKHSWPWTRLGYTYDWGNLYGHIGLSEFVVKNGAAIEVARSYSLDAYFAVAP